MRTPIVGGALGDLRERFVFDVRPRPPFIRQLAWDGWEIRVSATSGNAGGPGLRPSHRANLPGRVHAAAHFPVVRWDARRPLIRPPVGPTTRPVVVPAPSRGPPTVLVRHPRAR